MSNFKEISPEQIKGNAIELIGKDWMLITAETENKINTMTASWGGTGVIWNKNVSYIFIRPQRYTKYFVDNAECFSLSFFDNSFKKKLTYLGTVSGKNENKIEKSGLTLNTEKNAPYFEEAKLVLFCKKLYAQNLLPECFIYGEDAAKIYPEKDYHTMYIGEIQKVLIKE